MKRLLPLLLLIAISCNQKKTDYHNWSSYLGDKSSSQYSGLDEINNKNVTQLKQVWSYSSNDKDPNNRSQIQCNPLVIDGVLYGTSAKLKLFALNAATGKEQWTFDPFENNFKSFGMGVNRGLVYHEEGDNKRIFYSASHYLYAIHVEDGSLDISFGEEGRVDLKKGLGKDVDDLFLNSNTPGIIYKDLIIMGQRVSESTGAAPGHIRAYDVHTGEIEWTFKTIPYPGERGYNSWPEDAFQRIGGANVWAGFSVDEERGMVFCPTGSASFDFYGGDRHGSNLYANSILALDAFTGDYKWHFQTIHHDVWDKDLPAPPNLLTIKHEGKSIDVVAQITKNGLVYVLDRDTGKPIMPIEEIAVPQSQLIGEKTWPTQPLPTGFPKFSRIELTEKDLAVRNKEAAAFAKDMWTNSLPAHLYQPPSEQGTIIFPGFDGGGEWGGAAHDPETTNLIVNTNEIPWLAEMVLVKPESRGAGLYNSYCVSCHGENFEGGEQFGNVPSLLELNMRLNQKEVVDIIQNGKGVMPSFRHIDTDGIASIYDYIQGVEDKSIKTSKSSWPYPYRFGGYKKLYAPDGYPMITPPWGQLTSIDMNSKEIKWQIPLGEHKALSDKGMIVTGTENYGGPVVTAGGLVFIAATMDKKIRAFDKSTGQKLWSADLPAAGYATPAVYEVDGKQYVVIACGGGKLKSESGDSYVAFGL